MTLFEMVQQEVTAKQVAELYGMKFDRNGRGFCPWHDDGRHPALAFDKNGWCHCFVCNKNADSIQLAAKMLNLSNKEAAWRLKKDFHLDKPIDNRPMPSTKLKAQQRKDARAEINKTWGKLCDVVREADERLAGFTPETIDAEFDLLLDARCKANQLLDLMWEDMRSGRT